MPTSTTKQTPTDRARPPSPTPTILFAIVVGASVAGGALWFVLELARFGWLAALIVVPLVLLVPAGAALQVSPALRTRKFGRRVRLVSALFVGLGMQLVVGAVPIAISKRLDAVKAHNDHKRALRAPADAGPTPMNAADAGTVGAVPASDAGTALVDVNTADAGTMLVDGGAPFIEVDGGPAAWVPHGTLADCEPLWSSNDARDASRFNIVFVGAGFDRLQDFYDAAKRAIDLDNTARAQTGALGLMQIPVLQRERARFNFWAVERVQPFTRKDKDTIWSELYRFDDVARCQDALPNRVIPVFLYPRAVLEGMPYASYGRSYATIADCLTADPACSDDEKINLQQSNVHELLHTIPCLGDEYGANGSTATNAKRLETVKADFPHDQFWVGETYDQCVRNAPWRQRIGDGCGAPGVLDCFDGARAECAHPIAFPNGIDGAEQCCTPGMECALEVGCYQGGAYADVGVWRSTSNSVLRNPYARTQSAPLGLVDQDIIMRVIDKGPAKGRRWTTEVTRHLTDRNYQRDCDLETPEFAPYD